MEFIYFNDARFPILVSENTLSMTPHTFQRNGVLWENQSLMQFYNKIEPDKKYNIVDVGAQSGLYTLFAKYLPLSTFYAFEPFVETFHLLNENIEINKISNVHTYNIALSDSNEEHVILNTSIGHNGLHTMGKYPKRFFDIKPVEVKSTTMDSFFYDNDIPVDFIKIDTEGYEYFILKGAQKTISKYKPIIQLEWNVTNMEQCDVTVQMMNTLITTIGYKELGCVEEEKLIGPIT